MEANQDAEEETSDKFAFKSRKCPPQNKGMEKFEDKLLGMVKSIRFRKVDDEFQKTLENDIKMVNNSSKTFLPADKTANMYKLDKDYHTVNYCLRV